MTGMEIPVGPASIFTLILIGYFVLTVWFGKPQPVVQKAAVPKPLPPPEPRAQDLNAG